MPTLVGRSSRHILMAFRAMHYSVSLFGLGKQLDWPGSLKGIDQYMSATVVNTTAVQRLGAVLCELSGRPFLPFNT